MKLEFRIGDFTVFYFNTDFNKVLRLDILEYNEISLVTLLLNKQYKRLELLTFEINF